MTLLELCVSMAIFSVILLVAYGALQSARSFTRTNVTQVELQEEARHALEKIGEELQKTGRLTESATPKDRVYPKIYKSLDGLPSAQGYAHANSHPAKTNPKARPGSNVNGGDPTLDSDEIIFKVPEMDPATGLPTTSGDSIVWKAEEWGFFICPAADGTNNIELRKSSESQQQIDGGRPVQGEIVCRFVDRIQIQDYNTAGSSDPTLTRRHLRVTVYVSRVVGQATITVALSTIMDMRNASWQ